ncbi:MAG TPA: hypothetical protein VEL82_01485 [Thermoplasmata archaeon]|nr:hypothetical protein [Thermoplasmata archaeon]
MCDFDEGERAEYEAWRAAALARALRPRESLGRSTRRSLREEIPVLEPIAATG